MVSKCATRSWNESLVTIVDAYHPEPLGVGGVQNPHSFSLAHVDFVLFLGFEIVDDHQLLDVLLDEGVDSGFVGVGAPRVGSAVEVAGVCLAVPAVTATLEGGRVSWIHSVHDPGLHGRTASDSLANGIDAVAVRSLATLRDTWWARSGRGIVRIPWGRRHVGIVAGQVGIVDTGDLWL